MDNTTIKRNSPLILLMLFLMCFPLDSISASIVIGQACRGTVSRQASDTYEKMIATPNVIWGTISNVDVISLKQTDTLLFMGDNEQTYFFKENRYLESDYSYTQYVSSNNEEYVNLSILENDIQGNIRTNAGRYYIFSASEDEIVIVKYEPDGIMEEPEDITVSMNDEISPADSIGGKGVVPVTTPVIRVLFLYTSSALSMFSSQTALRNTVYSFMEEAKTSFANSNITAHLELAYLGPTNYNESAHTWSEVLSHFYGTNDGYMDEVHTLRNKYTADICVLMVNKDTYCGEAATINANTDNAFCMMYPSPTYCNYKYTAIHEIGHLVGCRHNRTHDGSTSPYLYGHGYFHYEANNYNASWRTVMSYDNSCDNGCQRILYWSNPNVTYNGYATGTTTYENNARVWNERAGTVGTFKTNNTSYVLSSINNNTSSLYESYAATYSIITTGGYEIQSGQTVDFAAPTEIRLSSTTHIKSGANFRASIRNNADDANYPQFIRDRHLETDLNIVNHHFLVSPNPVNDILTITTNEELAQISIYNLHGQCVLQTRELNINVAHLPAGVYMLQAVTIEGQSLQSKFIKR